MANIKFTNNASTTLAAPLADTDLSLVVAAGHGAKFPSLSGEEYFIGTLVRGDGAHEIVKVSDVSADTFTIERAQEGTTALDFSIGDAFELRLTAGSLNDILNIQAASELEAGIAAFANGVEVAAGIEEAKAVSPFRFQEYMGTLSVATPAFSLPASATEGTTVNGTYSVEAGATPIWSIPTEITDFTYGSGTCSFTAPTVSADTNFTVSLSASIPGKILSAAASETISVLNVPIQTGPTIAISNDTNGWPGATVEGTDITAPATSTGTNNTNQFASGEMEIVQTSGEFENIANASVSGFDTTTLVEVGDEVVTDTGESTVTDVTQGTTDYTATLSPELPGAPTKVFKKNSDLSMKLGAGITDEYLGPEVPLTWGTGSTTSDLVFESSESIKDKIYVNGGLHNDIEIDGVSHDVSAVSETPSTTSQTYITPEEATASFSVTGEDIFVDLTSNLPNDKKITHLGVATNGTASTGNTNALVILKRLGDKSVEVVLREEVELAATTGIQFFELSGGGFTGDGSSTYYAGYENLSGQPGGLKYISGQWRKAGDFGPVGSTISGLTDGIAFLVFHKYEETTYTTTATLTTPLAEAPAGTEVITIPDRCLYTPAGYTHTVTTLYKILADKITPTADPNLKRFAMRVAGPAGLTFTSAKIYTEEYPSA